MSEQIETLDDMRTTLGHLTAGRDWTALTAQAQLARAAYPEDWAPAYYEARGLIEGGRYEEAEHILMLAMDRFPRNGMLAVLYGQAGQRFPDRDDGIARWKSLLGRMPKLAQMYLGLATAYNAAGQAGEADHVLAEGLGQVPGNAQMLTGRAQIAWGLQDWPAALRLWGRLLKLRPDRTDAYTHIVTALYKLNRPEESDAVAREGLARNPEDLDLASAHAMAAVVRGDLAESARRWQAVLAFAPGYVFGSIGLSRAAQRQNLPELAETALRDGLRRNPDSDVLLIEYATLGSRAENWPEAVGRWSEAHLRCTPRLAIYTPYVAALERAGRLEEAETMAREALDMAPANQDLLVKYANFAALRGDSTEALRRWQVVERHAPGLEVTTRGMHDAQHGLRPTRYVPDAPRTAPPRAAPVPQAPVAPVPVAPLPVAQPVPIPPPVPEPVLSALLPQPVVEAMPQAAPTALDLLLSGGSAEGMVRPAEPEAVGLKGKLRRLFGKG